MPRRRGGVVGPRTARPLVRRLFTCLRTHVPRRGPPAGPAVALDDPNDGGAAPSARADAPTAPLPASQPATLPVPPPPTTDRVDLAVRALGGTDVWVHGRRVERWSSRRGKMIFRYLLWQRRPVRREVLMDLLWPYATPASARNNLNVAIYGLRRTLEVGGPGPYVSHREGSYQLAPGLTVWSDADAFETHRRLARSAVAEDRTTDADHHLSRATELYRGPLFADAADGEWYLTARRTLLEHYTDVLERRARLRCEAGDLDSCIDLCRQLLGVEPCHEVAHRQLMRSYAARGLYHLVARQYAECVRELRRRLDTSPHPETTSIYQALVHSR